jgi:methionine-rich copper-binding protein CopC
LQSHPTPRPTRLPRLRSPHRGRLRAAALAACLAALSVPLTPGPASAHNYLVSAAPAAGSKPAEPPTEVELVFNEVVRETGTGVVVTGPDGERWEDGAADIVGGTVTQSLRRLGPSGAYRVDYRVVSADGHPITGQVRFTLATAGGTTGGAPSAVPSALPTGAASAAPAPSATAAPGSAGDLESVQPASSDGGGLPGWLPILVAVVAVGLVSAAVVTRRREVGSDDD